MRQSRPQIELSEQREMSPGIGVCNMGGVYDVERLRRVTRRTSTGRKMFLLGGHAGGSKDTTNAHARNGL